MLADLDLAIYATVHEFKGGPKALAAHLSVRPGTLSNKADPACDTHHLNVSEALAIMLATRDYRILHALARAVNHVCIPLGDFSGISDVELLNSYANWHTEIGDTARAISDALSDRRIGRTEHARVRREGFEQIAAFLEFLSRLEALIDG